MTKPTTPPVTLTTVTTTKADDQLETFVRMKCFRLHKEHFFPSKRCFTSSEQEKINEELLLPSLQRLQGDL